MYKELLICICIGILVIGCNPSKEAQIEGAMVRVAKVDTEYVYEANVGKYVEDYQASRRNRISNFLGFSPDEILKAREEAIDHEIRLELKRMPGVEVSNKQVMDLAAKMVKEKAWEIYRKITEGGESFEDLAREYSEGITARQGGKLQPFGKLTNPQEYQSRAYEMKVGEVSEPFETMEGWYIVRLDDVKEDPVEGKQWSVSLIQLKADLEEAEAKILDEIAKGHTVEILDPKYNARRALNSGDYQAAEAAAREAIKRRNEDDLAHYILARVLWEKGEKENALEEMKKAAEVSLFTAGLKPYYHFYLGEYLQELGRLDEAKAAYRESFDTWRQDMNLGYELLAKFKEIGDSEYEQMMQKELDIMSQQDAVVLAFGAKRRGSGGIIVTGEGSIEGTSAEYIPGYRK